MQRKLSSSLVTQSFGSSTHSRTWLHVFFGMPMELDHVTLLRLGTFETKYDGTKYGEEYDSIQRRWHARAHTHAHTTFFLDKWKLPFSNKRKRQARSIQPSGSSTYMGSFPPSTLHTYTDAMRPMFISSTGCSALLACCSCYTRKGDHCNPTPSVEFAETGRNTGEGDKKRWKEKERGNGMAFHTIHVGRKATQKMPPVENPVARIRLVLLDRC
ncbi:hypothetical protein NCU05703 [Neurospora crassa OR74A]|uniref:Uncharacterized protein n=1 Tax=Neurospora crassa (strain ATCC 24698 / 74-OR23-1A / CBS 708.71 / DSM 1257 / FGSC 987) TaxID=367110 RepID=Q7SBN5_NEUCR|nr:hypothetical protein NCU05703 [Neurospora crassa OR74A]EAA33829.2 hypothetical protein NCU05703 [Neurospora crassa OR74A]|eukprot:XP_963065.2 hypothetical protein NCU05703 [Neurospora crassa OR74A]